MNRPAGLSRLLPATLAGAGAAGGDEIVVDREGSVEMPDIIEPPGIFVELTVDPDPHGHDIVADLDLGVLIPHTWQGDPTFHLQHVDSGRMFRVLERPGAPRQGFYGFSADNDGDPRTPELFILDDEAANPSDAPWAEHPGIESVTGRRQPDTEPLSGFDGNTIVGTWRFRVGDEGGGDVGTIERISPQFTTVPAPGALVLFIALCPRRLR